MLHRSHLCLGSNAKGYMNRVMVYAHRRRKARYLAPRNAHVRSPLANKSPEEYGRTWDPRTGVEWHNRLRNRNHYRHWPWARWTDDPIRHHRPTGSWRTVSATQQGCYDGLPEWDYYAEVGQDYHTPVHFPLSFTAPFILQYTAKCWTRETLTGYLETIQANSGICTIADAAARPDELYTWWSTSAMASIPLGVLQHVELLSKDMVLQARKKAFRHQQQQRGILRTADMERYYALPPLRGPAMPVQLAQPSGAYPTGKYTYMMADTPIHPLQQPDGRYTHNMYPL